MAHNDRSHPPYPILNPEQDEFDEKAEKLLQTLKSTPPSGIHKAICKVMADSKAIGKGRRNAHQNYNFRGIDDVYNELQEILAKHEVFTVPLVLNDRTEERKSASGSALIYRILTIQYTFYHSDGSFIKAVVIGEGMDSGDKASNKAMAVGHKYALLQVFAIPTEDAKDPENDSPAVAAKDAKTDAQTPIKTTGGLDPKREELWGLLTEMFKDGAGEKLKELTTFNGKNGVVEGKTDVRKISDKQVGFILKNTQKEHAKWKANGGGNEIQVSE